jgi:hypothetical protein
MSTWIFLPFGVFLGCCIAQFWFFARVRNALIDRHSETYLQIERSSIFPQGGLFRFIRSGRHRELRDPELTRAVIAVRWLYLTAIGAWLTLAAGIVLTSPD